MWSGLYSSPHMFSQYCCRQGNAKTMGYFQVWILHFHRDGDQPQDGAQALLSVLPFHRTDMIAPLAHTC